MPSVTFYWQEDAEYGGFGWVPAEQPKFNASKGFGVAHDTLEHFDLKAGTLEEELMAFGSIFYIRVDTGLMMERNIFAKSPGEILSGDISRFLRDRWSEVQGRVLKPFTGRPRHLDDLESDLDEAVLEAKKELREHEFDPDDWRAFNNANPTVWEDLRRWIRAGYWKCKRRYRGVRNYELASAFCQIEREVDRISADIHDRLKVTVRMSRKMPKVIVKHIPEWDLEQNYYD